MVTMTREDLYAYLTTAGHALVFILALGALFAHCDGAFDYDEGVYARQHVP